MTIKADDDIEQLCLYHFTFQKRMHPRVPILYRHFDKCCPVSLYVVVLLLLIQYGSPLSLETSFHTDICQIQSIMDIKYSKAVMLTQQQLKHAVTN